MEVLRTECAHVQTYDYVPLDRCPASSHIPRGFPSVGNPSTGARSQMSPALFDAAWLGMSLRWNSTPFVQPHPHILRSSLALPSISMSHAMFFVLFETSLRLA